MAERIYPHGTHARYALNRCRCDECRAAHTDQARRRKRAIAYGRWEGLVDATGTMRRIRALNAIGYSCIHIAARLGTHKKAVQDDARMRYARIAAATARAYAELYDDLCTGEGPSAWLRTMGRKRGWPGPEAWTDDTIDDPDAQPMAADVVDEVAVRRAIDGDEAAIAALNPAERLEATRRLVRRGAGTGAVSRQLRLSGTAAAKLVGQARVLEGVAA